MNGEEYNRAIEYYRAVATEEMKNERIVDGMLIGPRSEVNNRKLELKDFLTPSRTYFGGMLDEKSDTAYVSTFRIGHFNIPEQLALTGQGTSMVGGMEFGSNLVLQGIIKNELEVIKFLHDYKVGIIDLFEETEADGGKVLDLRVYECIECSGLPNIGRPVCYFEAGIITGIFKELTKKDVIAEEVRCWTNGYSFCQFEVAIK